MKPIIGIIGRKDTTNSKVPFDGNFFVYDYIKAIDKANGLYIGILINEEYGLVDESILNKCDGFLLTGGVEIKACHYKIVEYAFKNNIPILGICLGCQAIGICFGSINDEVKLQKTDDINSDIKIVHRPDINSNDDRKNISHTININKGTYLYKLLGKKASVNSHHGYCIKKVDKPLIVSATSDDNVIEAVEYIDNNNFILGIQWHPEYMDDMQIIFDEFIKRCIKKEVV